MVYPGQQKWVNVNEFTYRDLEQRHDKAMAAEAENIGAAAILWLKKCGTTGFSCQKMMEKKNEKKGKKWLTFWNTFAIIILALENRPQLFKKS